MLLRPELLHQEWQTMMDKKVRESVVKNSYLGRELKPLEVAKQVVFLSSDMAKKINGQILKLDGKQKNAK